MIRCLMVLTLGLLITVLMIFPEVSATDISITHIQQGQKVQVNDTIDISGVEPPYDQLAYWDGYDMYDSAPTYIINLPNNRHGWYNFYVDPGIFATRLGSWYKYDATVGYESRGNNLAFVVTKQNIVQMITNPPTNDITETITPIPTPSTLTPTFIPTPTPTQPQWNFEKRDYALWISVLIVGLCFGCFELYRFRISGKK